MIGFTLKNRCESEHSPACELLCFTKIFKFIFILPEAGEKSLYWSWSCFFGSSEFHNYQKIIRAKSGSRQFSQFPGHWRFVSCHVLTQYPLFGCSAAALSILLIVETKNENVQVFRLLHLPNSLSQCLHQLSPGESVPWCLVPVIFRKYDWGGGTY